MCPESNIGRGQDPKQVKAEVQNSRIENELPKHLGEFLGSLETATPEEVESFKELDPSKPEDAVIVERVENTLLVAMLPQLVNRTKMDTFFNQDPKDFSWLNPSKKRNQDLWERDQVVIAAGQAAIEKGNLRVIAAKLMSDLSEEEFASVITAPMTGILEGGFLGTFTRIDGPSESQIHRENALALKAVLIVLNKRGVQMDPGLSWRELLEEEGYLESVEGEGKEEIHRSIDPFIDANSEGEDDGAES